MQAPGHHVDSNAVHKALPKKLQKKIARRTIIRRLAAKGYVPEKKLSKTDPEVADKQKRYKWCMKHRGTTAQQWKSQLQAIGDFKDFTHYPRELQPKFRQLRSSWTYMTKAEKRTGPFLRPKKWFPEKEWKKTKKQKLFAMTTSNGKVLAFLVPKPFSAEQWAALVRRKVAPFLKKAFPGKTSFQVLLDGEKLLHAPVTKAAMRIEGITVLPGWPPRSPELNPQENVWPWAEKHLRLELEGIQDDFQIFRKNIVKAVKAYPSSKKLVGSMAKKIAQCLERGGGMVDS